MVRELRARGFPASKPRVERLVRESGIRARHKRCYKATADSKHALPVAPNLLDERKANCLDNAPIESFVNSLKNERVLGTRYATRTEVAADLFDYIEVFYNRSRRHSALGYHSPVQFLQDWITNQHERKIAA